MNSSIKENVITLFTQKGYQKSSYISEQMIKSVINQRSNTILHIDFKDELIEEVIQRCKNNKFQISPITIGECLEQAYFILKDRINVLNGQNGLIQDRRKSLEECKEKLTNDKNENNNQLPQQIETIQKQLSQLQNNATTFTQQFSQIQNLFITHSLSSLKKKKASQLPPPPISPKTLAWLFYMAVIGILLQLIVTQIRPGFIAIAVYLQLLYLLLVGYYCKHCVRVLMAANGIAILYDCFGLFWLYYFKVLGYSLPLSSYIYYQFLKILLFMSICMRVFIEILLRNMIQPPLTKIYYEICGKQLILNMRLNIRNRQISC